MQSQSPLIKAGMVAKEADLLPKSLTLSSIPPKELAETTDKKEAKVEDQVRYKPSYPPVQIFNQTGGAISLNEKALTALIEFYIASSGSGPGTIGRIFNLAEPNEFPHIRRVLDKIVKTPMSEARVLPIVNIAIDGPYKGYSYFNHNGQLKSWVKPLFFGRVPVLHEVIKLISEEALSFVLPKPEDVHAESKNSSFSQQIINVSTKKSELEGEVNYLQQARTLFSDDELLVQLATATGMVISYMLVSYANDRDAKLPLADLSEIQDVDEYERLRIRQKTYLNFLNGAIGKVMTHQRLLLNDMAAKAALLKKNYIKYMREKGTIPVELLPFIRSVNELKSSNKTYIAKCLSNLCCDPLTRAYLITIANIALTHTDDETIFALAVQLFQKEYALFKEYTGDIPEKNQIRLVESVNVLKNLIAIKEINLKKPECVQGLQEAKSDVESKSSEKSGVSYAELAKDIGYLGSELYKNLIEYKNTTAKEMALVAEILALVNKIILDPLDRISSGLLHGVLNLPDNQRFFIKNSGWRLFIDNVQLILASYSITDKNFLYYYASQYNELKKITLIQDKILLPSKKYLQMAQTLLETKHQDFSNHPMNLEWMTIAIIIHKIPHHWRLYEASIEHLNAYISHPKYSSDDLVKFNAALNKVVIEINQCKELLVHHKSYRIHIEELRKQTDAILDEEKNFIEALQKILIHLKLTLEKLEHEFSDPDDLSQKKRVENDKREALYRESIQYDKKKEVSLLQRSPTIYYMQPDESQVDDDKITHQEINHSPKSLSLADTQVSATSTESPSTPSDSSSDRRQSHSVIIESKIEDDPMSSSIRPSPLSTPGSTPSATPVSTPRSSSLSTPISLSRALPTPTPVSSPRSFQNNPVLHFKTVETDEHNANTGFFAGYQGWKKWALIFGLILLIGGIVAATGGFGAIPVGLSGLATGFGFGFAYFATLKNKVFQNWYQRQHWVVQGLFSLLGGAAFIADLFISGGLISAAFLGMGAGKTLLAGLTTHLGLSTASAVSIKTVVGSVSGVAAGTGVHFQSSTRGYADQLGGIQPSSTLLEEDTVSFEPKAPPKKSTSTPEDRGEPPSQETSRSNRPGSL